MFFRSFGPTEQVFSTVMKIFRTNRHMTRRALPALQLIFLRGSAASLRHTHMDATTADGARDTRCCRWASCMCCHALRCGGKLPIRRGDGGADDVVFMHVVHENKIDRREATTSTAVYDTCQVVRMMHKLFRGCCRIRHILRRHYWSTGCPTTKCSVYLWRAK